MEGLFLMLAIVGLGIVGVLIANLVEIPPSNIETMESEDEHLTQGRSQRLAH